ncbi:MAG: 50S ribosomal protein L15 [Desulfurococcales archaeon]|nr:50S ribosomal protein L15 [Desulfurococcales archaeon]
MVVRRKKKSRKLRGRTRTMGWGRIGQHRKSGSRGGHGAAGLGKHKWTWTIKYAPTWYGKKGFNPPRIRVGMEVRAVNVGVLDEIAAAMEASGEARREDGKIVIDLAAMGVHKLLGSGRITRPIKVIVPMASERAKAKVKEAGGEVVTLVEEEG